MLRRLAQRFALGQRFDARKDYYKTLGVPPAAGKEQVRKAYIALVKRFHPDKGAHNDSKIKEINEANEVLSDDALRAEYDQAVRGAAGASSAGAAQGSYQAYRSGGEYQNPFSSRQRAAGRAQDPFRDVQGGAQRRSGEGIPRDFEELLRNFARRVDTARQTHEGRARREERESFSARQASPDWARDDFDFQRAQKEKEERAREDLARKLGHLFGAWRMFRASATQKGFWRGLLDAFLFYTSQRR